MRARPDRSQAFITTHGISFKRQPGRANKAPGTHNQEEPNPMPEQRRHALASRHAKVHDPNGPRVTSTITNSLTPSQPASWSPPNTGSGRRSQGRRRNDDW